MTEPRLLHMELRPHSYGELPCIASVSSALAEEIGAAVFINAADEALTMAHLLL